jgi:quercetin dioxygenase-like cupin family protein
MRTTTVLKSALPSLLLVGAAFAAAPVDPMKNSGPMTTSIPLPDPSHLPINFGKDVKWKPNADGGEETAVWFGDLEKPGPYGILIRWNPGFNSKPHFHSSDRFIYVVSGVWWVSASTTYDKTKMYPVPAGSFATDIHNTIHWDGAKKETGPCIILLVGEGPVKTVGYKQKDPNSLEFTPPDDAGN